jgi:hypothetical protein
MVLPWVLWMSWLNFGILSLIPRKTPGAYVIKQYKIIALINVIFKFITKSYASRLSWVAHNIISPIKTAFIKGRLIFYESLSLHEIIHDIKIQRSGAILLKLDFEKAYD